MSDWRSIVAVLMLAGVTAVGLAGCSQQAEQNGTAESDTAEVTIPEEMSGIAKLPEEDQRAALDQRICPVTEKPLGSMGKPIEVAVEGQEIFVCCEGCIETVKENPDEYLVKLNKEK